MRSLVTVTKTTLLEKESVLVLPSEAAPGCHAEKTSWTTWYLLSHVVTAIIWLLSRVQVFVTPWTVARQAPLSMGFSQERIPGWAALPSFRGSSPPGD